MASMLDLSSYQLSPIAAGPSGASGAQAPAPGILDAIFSPRAPYKPTGADAWGILGATLRDVGSNLRGEKADALAQQEKLVQAEAAGAPNAAQVSASKVGKGGKAAPADSALLYQAAKNLFPNDPKAQFLFATGNTDFLKSVGDGYGFHTVTGGDTVFGAPGQAGPIVAPKLVANGNQYGTQTADGYTDTGTGALSAEEQAGQQNAATAATKAAEDVRHNQAGEGIDRQKVGIEGAQLGVAKQHLGIDQSNSTLEHLKFGHAANPAAPVVYSQGDYDKLPSGQHIQYVAPDGSLRIKP